ncbi:MAG TPA: hypothetical protein VK138_07520 [Acidiferrobacterales bacterium]|nr:hypothetical protein [Acidiferrobacterales bacterium]
MARARISFNPLDFAGEYVLQAWSRRNDMTEEQCNGFFQFTHITACSYIESLLSHYLVSVISEPTIVLRKAKGFAERTTKWQDGDEVKVDVELENRAVQRLLEQFETDLNGAPFARLISFHTTILGRSLSDIVGPSLYARVNGLVAIRNVLAHGRPVYVDLVSDPGGSKSLVPEANFDAHPLKSVFQALASDGLYDPANARSGPLVDSLRHIYREEVVRYFWDATRQVADIYIQLGAEQGFIDAKHFQRLPPLPA